MLLKVESYNVAGLKFLQESSEGILPFKCKAKSVECQNLFCD
uniref:Uncharacterized protein n=1 Tax=Rhizophora mucronata TaxID=61149 RepID=A0A2P2PWL2_RHIMU